MSTEFLYNYVNISPFRLLSAICCQIAIFQNFNLAEDFKSYSKCSKLLSKALFLTIFISATFILDMYISDMMFGKSTIQYNQIFLRGLNWYSHFSETIYICTIASILYSGVSFFKKNKVCRESCHEDLENSEITEIGIFGYSCSDYFDFNIFCIVALALAITIPVLIIPLCNSNLFSSNCDLLDERTLILMKVLLKDIWAYLASVFSLYALYVSTKSKKVFSAPLTEKTQIKEEEESLLNQENNLQAQTLDLESNVSTSGWCCINFQIPRIVVPWFIVSLLTIILPSFSRAIGYIGIDTPVTRYLSFISNVIYETKGIYILCAILSMPRDERI
ncbi:hypothetical protein AYI68_g2655 [Smittium mucronatum]|uniref:Uncharacterized protein n=1 Tax=Smittium mucronatum TaxID=133383 RepID=A0A1R0H237_9FUNG|nr:hypothetical protein AYI68_g2655 [Smittium mucronatum]